MIKSTCRYHLNNGFYKFTNALEIKQRKTLNCHDDAFQTCKLTIDSTSYDDFCETDGVDNRLALNRVEGETILLL